MASTATRRKLKKIRVHKKKKVYGSFFVMVGVACLSAKVRLPGLFSALLGLWFIQKSEVSLKKLQHPHSFRAVYPDVFRVTLEYFPSAQFHDLFRFPKKSIKKHLAFFTEFCNLPELVHVEYYASCGRNQYTYSLEELYLMLLYTLSVPVRHGVECAEKFGRTPPEISVGLKYMHSQLYAIATQYLHSDNQPWFSSTEAKKCAKMLRKKGCPLKGASQI